MDNLIETYCNRREKLYLFTFGIYFAGLILLETVLCQNDTFALIVEVIRKIIYILIAVQIGLNVIAKIYTKKELILFLAVNLFLFFIIITAKNIIYTVLWLFMFAAKDVNFRKIIKLAFLISGGMMILLVSGSMLGIIQDRIFLRGSEWTRHSLGYGYATVSANFYLHILLMYMYLKKKVVWKEIVVLTLFNFFLYMQTDTKSAFVLGCIVILFFVLYWKNKFSRQTNITGIGAIIASIVAPIFCVGLQSIYVRGGYFIQVVNEKLSGRLFLADSALRTYGVGLLGQQIEWTGATEYLGKIYDAPIPTYNYVDSSYLQYLINFGIIYLVLITILWALMSIRANKEKTRVLSFVFCIIIAHSLFDPQLMWLSFNPFLLYMFASTDEKEEMKQ